MVVLNLANPSASSTKRSCISSLLPLPAPLHLHEDFTYKNSPRLVPSSSPLCVQGSLDGYLPPAGEAARKRGYTQAFDKVRRRGGFCVLASCSRTASPGRNVTMGPMRHNVAH